jgi:arylformamidase
MEAEKMSKAAERVMQGLREAEVHAPASRPRGPRVWLDMDQQELDDAYDQLVYAPNRDVVLRRSAANSAATRERLGVPTRLAYGASPIEALDLYATTRPRAPINVFIHGGAWRQRPAKDFALPAEMHVAAGAHYVVLDFTSVEETGGDLMPMAEQVRGAVAWVYRNAETLGGDPNRIYVSGHSSGAHLAGVVLTTDWEQEFGLPGDTVKGGLLGSGMYELEPVRLSKRSQYVKFTDAIVAALSSQRHIDKLHCPIAVAHGTEETPEFQRQARDFASAVTAAGKPVALLVGDGLNHFEMFETFGNPYGLLGRAALEMMGLANSDCYIGQAGVRPA